MDSLHEVLLASHKLTVARPTAKPAGCSSSPIPSARQSRSRCRAACRRPAYVAATAATLLVLSYSLRRWRQVRAPDVFRQDCNLWPSLQLHLRSDNDDHFTHIAGGRTAGLRCRRVPDMAPVAPHRQRQHLRSRQGPLRTLRSRCRPHLSAVPHRLHVSSGARSDVATIMHSNG